MIFISLHSSSIVPVYAFGENDLFEQVPNPQGSKVRRFQNFLTHAAGFSPALFHGRGVFNYTFGLLPFRKPVFTVGEFGFYIGFLMLIVDYSIMLL